MEELNHTVAELKKRGVKQVAILGRKDQGLNGQMILQRSLIKHSWMEGNLDRFSGNKRNNEAINLNSMIKSLNGDFLYIDLMRIACPEEHRCHVLTPDGDIIFVDVMHLSKHAYKFMGRKLYEENGLAFLGMPFSK